MIKADVNLSILFDELSVAERPGVAAKHGFVAGEIWRRLPESVPTHGRLGELAEAFENAGVPLVGLNVDAGELAAGDRGLTSVPAQETRLRDNVDVAMKFAEPPRGRAFNACNGNRHERKNPVIQDELATENLCYASEATHRIGGVVLIESQNSAANCPYPLPRAADVVDVVERVEQACGASNVRLLADLFHVHRMGEDLTASARTFPDRFGHVQIADDRGRHQTGEGKIDVGPALAVLSEFDCQGSTGLWIRRLSSGSFSPALRLGLRMDSWAACVSW
ncbi:MAG TPA: TIM barrel protein [Candidatus Saccharimonadales bacterium]|nr:TIM barrel protein [Candidatus Saccharimonadales bacterium]